MYLDDSCVLLVQLTISRLSNALREYACRLYEFLFNFDNPHALIYGITILTFFPLFLNFPLLYYINYGVLVKFFQVRFPLSILCYLSFLSYPKTDGIYQKNDDEKTELFFTGFPPKKSCLC